MCTNMHGLFDEREITHLRLKFTPQNSNDVTSLCKTHVISLCIWSALVPIQLDRQSFVSYSSLVGDQVSTHVSYYIMLG